MSKQAKRRRTRGGSADPASGAGDLLGQIGLFETGNGLPHGPIAIVAAIVVAVVIYPITRFVRFLARR